MQRLRWHGCLAAPYAPCSCCAGGIPAIRRAAAARHICSASARSWPHRVSMSRCGRRAIEARPAATSSTVCVSTARAAPTPSTSGPGWRWWRRASVSDRCDACARTWSSTPRTACPSWRAWPTAAESSCSCTTATASSGQWPADGRAASAGSSSRGCRHGCTGATSTSPCPFRRRGISPTSAWTPRTSQWFAMGSTRRRRRRSSCHVPNTRASPCSAGWCRTSRSSTRSMRSPSSGRGCPDSISTSSVAAGGATASSTTRGCSVSPTR